MDFRVNEDQAALVGAVRWFCEARVPLEKLRVLEQSRLLDRELWSALGELGVFGLRKQGLGAAEAVLVFAELGRALVPGPLAASYLAAELVDGAGEGRSVVGALDLSRGARAPYLVEHLDAIDVLLVLRADGIERIDARAIEGRAIERPLDPLTPASRVDRLPDGERIGGADEAARFRLHGAALVAAQLLGSAEATQVMAVAYAKLREQFGRPIGSFQAIKHLCADLFVRQELARAAVYCAGASLDQLSPSEAEVAVSAAKIVAAQAAEKNARTCLQIHGGMGYTWEVPVHYHLKRAWMLRTLFGGADEHAGRLAEGLAAG